jgi:hypothetical protein
MAAYDIINWTEATVVGCTLVADRFWVANRAYSFDGVDDRIDYWNTNNITWDITLSAWVYTTKNTGYEWILAKSQWATNVPYELRFNTNNWTYALAFLRASTSNYWYWYTPSLTTEMQNKWCHIVVTNTWSTCQFYINWQPVTTTLDRVVWTPSATANTWRIWSVNNWQYFWWNISEPIIFNKALSAWEVKQLYEQSKTKYLYPFKKTFPLSLNDWLVFYSPDWKYDIVWWKNLVNTSWTVTDVRFLQHKWVNWWASWWRFTNNNLWYTS